MTKDLFKKYHLRLAKEGFVKALLWGLTVGFGVLFLSSAALWFLPFKGWWLSIVLSAVVAAGATVVFYFLKFRPTVKSIAKRVDSLGLEERLLTMTQLENDQSYIAVRQREDAKSALNWVSSKAVKFAISLSLIVAVSVTGLLGAGMNVIYALYSPQEGGYLDGGPGGKLIEFEVLYETEGAGYIEGDIFQVVEQGKDAAPVMAVAMDGWVFTGWFDNLKETDEPDSEDPYRMELSVKKDLAFIAVFQELSEGAGGGGGEDGDQPPPDDEQEGPKEPSEGDNGEGDNEGIPQDPGNSDGGGGRFEEVNYVIDGQTFYGGSTFENAYSEAIARIIADETIPDDVKKILLDYYRTIEK